MASARLGGIDEEILLEAGLTQESAVCVLERSFDAVSVDSDPRLRASLSRVRPILTAPLPQFVLNLLLQPRAGATRPGMPRMMLLPAESHADHCACVAVYSVLLAPRYLADCVKPFLAALIHHAHNAWLPDSGFTGEEMLGEHLAPVLHNLREKAYSQLPEQLRQSMREALEETAGADTPEAKAFHAADVLDRVLQMRWYEQAASFTLKVAMDDMELVHAGPVQAFHQEVLREAGLW